MFLPCFDECNRTFRERETECGAHFFGDLRSHLRGGVLLVRGQEESANMREFEAQSKRCTGHIMRRDEFPDGTQIDIALDVAFTRASTRFVLERIVGFRGGPVIGQVCGKLLDRERHRGQVHHVELAAQTAKRGQSQHCAFNGYSDTDFLRSYRFAHTLTRPDSIN